MERVLTEREPVQQNERNLSQMSKIFFGVDIFQVIVAVVFQGYMIGQGDFSKIDPETNPAGMGPGRRVYMGIYMGAIVYTCFLCLFAVKNKNFMEVLAFVLQNFLFVSYSCIQVYQVGFKTTNSGLQTPLSRIALANAMVLFVLNIVFIYLAYQLYSEYGWKIYKKVRMDMRLRGVYKVYELLVCLLKMEMLYYGMYAICHAVVLLRDSRSVLYYVSLGLIPLSIMHAALGWIATYREMRPLMLLFLAWTVGVGGYFFYKLYGFLTESCTGCKQFVDNGEDIPQEAFMHFIYLASTNLIVVLLVFIVSLKAYRNFGAGLADQFRRKEGRNMSLNLSLRRPSNIEESCASVTSCDSPFQESLDFPGINHGSPSVLPLLAKATLQIGTRPTYGRQRSKEKALSELRRISENIEIDHEKMSDENRRGSVTGEDGNSPNASANAENLHANGKLQIHVHNSAVSTESSPERSDFEPDASHALQSRARRSVGDRGTENRCGNNEWLDSGIWVGTDNSSGESEHVVLLPAASPHIGAKTGAESPESGP